MLVQYLPIGRDYILQDPDSPLTNILHQHSRPYHLRSWNNNYEGLLSQTYEGPQTNYYIRRTQLHINHNFRR